MGGRSVFDMVAIQHLLIPSQNSTICGLWLRCVHGKIHKLTPVLFKSHPLFSSRRRIPWHIISSQCNFQINKSDKTSNSKNPGLVGKIYGSQLLSWIYLSHKFTSHTWQYSSIFKMWATSCFQRTQSYLKIQNCPIFPPQNLKHICTPKIKLHFKIWTIRTVNYTKRSSIRIIHWYLSKAKSFVF